MNHNDGDFEILLVKAVDGLLSPDENVRFQALIDASPARFAEYEDHMIIKQETDAFTQRILQDARVNPTPSNLERAEVGLSTLLLAVASFIALSFVLYHVISEPLPIPLKVALCLGLAGIIVLSIHVLRRRVRSPRDPYKDIDR